MKISVFGAGYVGAVSSAALAKLGNDVVAVDPNELKIGLINEGRSPIVEAGLDELLAEAIRSKKLVGITNAAAAVAGTDLSLVCVGTPSQRSGNLDTTYIQRVCAEIGAALKTKTTFHSVVMRSTMLPGTMREIVIPGLEAASGKRAGKDFGIAIYPEFLRESTAIADYFNPGIIVLGIEDETTLLRLREVNAPITAKEVVTDLASAEAIKYANNAWHAVKITFANEIGNISRSVGIDGQKVMEIVCQDSRLNISTAYMKPGFAFGGSCLPKDLRAITYKARQMDVSTPLLNAIIPSNRNQLDAAYSLVAGDGGSKRRIGLLGLSFKAGTDDLRESPLVELAEQLLGKGHDIRIYDPNVRLSAIMGSNLDFINQRIPHLSRLMVDSADEVLDHAQVLVVGNADPRFIEIINRSGPNRDIVDLVRINSGLRSRGPYQGICW